MEPLHDLLPRPREHEDRLQQINRSTDAVAMAPFLEHEMLDRMRHAACVAAPATASSATRPSSAHVGRCAMCAARVGRFVPGAGRLERAARA